MKNINLKKILKYLIIFIILCIFIFYANSLNVKAATVPSSCQFYDNLGSSQTQLLTISGRDNSGNIAYYTTENSFTLTANSYGGLLICSLDTPLIANKIYSLSMYIDLNVGTARTSIKSNLGSGTSIESARLSYINNTNIDENNIYYSNSVLTYVFTSNSTASYIAVPFGSTSTIFTTPYLRDFKIEYQGNANELSSNDIQNIVSNSNSQMSQSIIENQNKNNDNLIESNQELLGNCNTNLMSSSNIISLDNLWQDGNDFQQQQADTASSLTLLTQAFNNGSYMYPIGNSVNISSVGRYTIGFTKRNDYNQIKFKLNGRDRDTGLLIDISNLESDIVYYISADFYNLTQGNIRFKNIMISKSNTTTFVPWGQTICNSKLDDTNDKLDDTNNKLNDLKDNITNSDSSNAKNDANNFFSNFQTDTFGLTSIITAPLNLISSLTSKTCSPLNLPLPFINKNLPLPCLSTIYSEYFGSFLTIYQTITFGIVAYWVCVRIFNLVKDFKNPDHDEIEVMDL